MKAHFATENSCFFHAVLFSLVCAIVFSALPAYSQSASTQFDRMEKWLTTEDTEVLGRDGRQLEMRFYLPNLRRGERWLFAHGLVSYNDRVSGWKRAIESIIYDHPGSAQDATALARAVGIYEAGWYGDVAARSQEVSALLKLGLEMDAVRHFEKIPADRLSDWADAAGDIGQAAGFISLALSAMQVQSDVFETTALTTLLMAMDQELAWSLLESLKEVQINDEAYSEAIDQVRRELQAKRDSEFWANFVVSANQAIAENRHDLVRGGIGLGAAIWSVAQQNPKSGLLIQGGRIAVDGVILFDRKWGNLRITGLCAKLYYESRIADFPHRDLLLERMQASFFHHFNSAFDHNYAEFYEWIQRIRGGDDNRVVLLEDLESSIADAAAALAATAPAGAEEGNGVITELHKAAEQGRTDVVRRLIAEGADVNARADMKVFGELGNDVTALHLAAEMGHAEIAAVLLENGANADASTSYRFADNLTALHFAASRGAAKIVNILIQSGADVNTTTLLDGAERVTALHFAAKNRHTEIVKILVQNGADVNASWAGPDEGTTALHIAAHRGHAEIEIVKLLLANGADINAASTMGDTAEITALHFAVDQRRPDIELVEILLQHQADVSAANSQGQTPLDIARERGHTDIVELLIRHTTADDQRAGAHGQPANLGAGLSEVSNAEYPSVDGLAPGSRQAQQRQRAAVEELGLPLEVECNLTGMRFRLIPAGEFLMGSPSDESGRRDDEGPQRTVKLTQPFYMSTTPVTQAQYRPIMGSNPSAFEGDNLPVEQVSWNGATEFTARMSEQTGLNISLPTEAQWEYACRAGTTTPYYFGNANNRLGEYAWFWDNSARRTHPVGQKKPNAFGLYDMHGNVLEWCLDWFQDSYNGLANEDPAGAQSGTHRVLRGGSWGTNAPHCRSAHRYWNRPRDPYHASGFRVVISYEEENFN